MMTITILQLRIDAIVVSTQHDDFRSETEKAMLAKIKSDDVINILVPRVIKLNSRF